MCTERRRLRQRGAEQLARRAQGTSLEITLDPDAGQRDQVIYLSRRTARQPLAGERKPDVFRPQGTRGTVEFPGQRNRSQRRQRERQEAVQRGRIVGGQHQSALEHLQRKQAAHAPPELRHYPFVAGLEAAYFRRQVAGVALERRGRAKVSRHLHIEFQARGIDELAEIRRLHVQVEHHAGKPLEVVDVPLQRQVLAIALQQRPEAGQTVGAIFTHEHEIGLDGSQSAEPLRQQGLEEPE